MVLGSQASYFLPPPPHFFFQILGKQGKSYCLLACLQCKDENHASSANSLTATKGYSETLVNNANRAKTTEAISMHKLSLLPQEN